MAAKFKRKRTKAEPLPKLKINTGREGQQSLNANPISRAVLLKSWVSPVIRDLKKFRFLMTDERVSQSRCEALRPSVLSLMALHANACKNKPAYESKLSTQNCFYSRSHLYVP